MNAKALVGVAGIMISALLAPSAGRAQTPVRPPGPRRPPLPAPTPSGLPEMPAPQQSPGMPAAPAEPPPAPLPRLELAPGRISDEIKCVGDNRWSYYVYAPRDYQPDRPWPVLFVISPIGGQPALLHRYVPGADFNGWLVVLPVQPRNDFNDWTRAALASLNDALRRLPGDPRRIYASGFSGGARMATALALHIRGIEFAGLLICGAAQVKERYPKQLRVYGLSGTNCFNRWEMACLFEKPQHPDWRLEFFFGEHDWADETELELGMVWLHAATLRAIAEVPEFYNAERERLANAIAARIGELKAAQPERAWDWAERLMLLSDAAAKPLVEELRRDPKVPRYIEGRAQLAAFWKKYFATDPADAVKNDLPSKAVKDSENLAEKYRDSRLASLFRQMGRPSAPLPLK